MQPKMLALKTFWSFHRKTQSLLCGNFTAYFVSIIIIIVVVIRSHGESTATVPNNFVDHLRVDTRLCLSLHIWLSCLHFKNCLFSVCKRVCVCFVASIQRDSKCHSRNNWSTHTYVRISQPTVWGSGKTKRAFHFFIQFLKLHSYMYITFKCSVRFWANAKIT